jgi:hypothetical protein
MFLCHCTCGEYLFLESMKRRSQKKRLKEAAEKRKQESK